MGSTSLSAIAIDPTNTDIIYVGANSRFQQGKGILKSTDGGASWIVLGSGFPAGNNGNSLTLFQGQNVDHIIVDPANSSVLYLASDAGLFRSTDSGQNWTLGGNGGTGGSSIVAVTLALDPTSPVNSRILYAGINGSGIRQSTNGGLSWLQILNSSTPAVR